LNSGSEISIHKCISRRMCRLHTYCLFEPSFYGRFFPNIRTLYMALFKPISCVVYSPFTCFSPSASAYDRSVPRPQQIHYCDSEYTVVLLPGRSVIFETATVRGCGCNRKSVSSRGR